MVQKLPGVPGIVALAREVTETHRGCVHGAIIAGLSGAGMLAGGTAACFLGTLVLAALQAPWLAATATVATATTFAMTVALPPLLVYAVLLQGPTAGQLIDARTVLASWRDKRADWADQLVDRDLALHQMAADEFVEQHRDAQLEVQQSLKRRIRRAGLERV